LDGAVTHGGSFAKNTYSIHQPDGHVAPPTPILRGLDVSKEIPYATRAGKVKALP
jgi:hypothetical protein